MPVFKNESNGTWYVMARYVNWKGERKQKCKRGFATKKEAQEWERMFQLQNSSDMDMSFEAFTELYIAKRYAPNLIFIDDFKTKSGKVNYRCSICENTGKTSVTILERTKEGTIYCGKCNNRRSYRCSKYI